MRCQIVLRSAALAALAAVGDFALAGDIAIRASPVFQGLSRHAAMQPLAIDITNRGRSCSGVLTVDMVSQLISYPVELPSVSVKKVFVYYPNPWADPVNLRLTTANGTVELTNVHCGSATYSKQAIAMISNSSGSLEFLATKGKIPSPAPACYTTPEMAPDRPIGYSSFSTIVLGEGSERLNNSQVAAIKLFLTRGGRLLFVGGAASRVCEDRRWSNVLPVENLHRVQAPAWAAFVLGGSPIKSGFPVLVGTLRSGAFAPSRGRSSVFAAPLIAVKHVGLGNVIFLAFDPFTAPFTHWDARRNLINNILKDVEAETSSYTRQFEGVGSAGWQSRFYGGGISRPMLRRPLEEPKSSPFEAKLPPAGGVFWVLGAFFVAVVPINFWILRRLKKREWAWLTSPILSLGFASYLLSAAGSLYSSKLSRSTSGLLIGGENLSQGIYLGKTEFFFPKAGSYDLKLTHIDQVDEDRADYYPYDDYADYYSYRDCTSYPWNRRSDSHLLSSEITDVGEVQAKKASVGNLSFRELRFAQIVPMGTWFTLQGKLTFANGVPEFLGRFTNSSPYVLTNASLVAYPWYFDIQSRIRPGQSVVITGKWLRDSTPQHHGEYPPGLRLEAELLGFHFGPQLGDEVAGRGGAFLAYSLNLPLPEEMQ